METINLTAKLTIENDALKDEIIRLKTYNADLESRLNWFIEQLKRQKRREFGASSEKSAYDNVQISLFNEAEYLADPKTPEPDRITVREHNRKTRLTTDKLPPDLPVEIIEYTLDDKDQVCPVCGDALHRIGKESVRKELKIIPAKAVITEHIRNNYGCRRCESESETATIIKAPLPNPAIRGSFASPEAVAHLMVQKFVMGVPLYRQEKEFERRGIALSRQTMANWIIRCSDDWLKPIYDLLHRRLLEREVVHADETEFQVLNEPGRTARQKSYLWVYRTGNDGLPPIVLTEYQPGRHGKHAAAFLNGFKGYLHTDGYGGYHNLSSDITIIGCFAHVRRRFDEALKTLPADKRDGTDALRGKRYCDSLFEIERRLFGLTHEERYLRRLTESKPVLDEFRAWLSSFRQPGKTLFLNAVRYTLEQWPYLANYLLDGRLEISNNRTERTVKLFVIDRKNFLFANTPAGARASAVVFSVIETALENGLDPYDYLVYVFRTAPNVKNIKDLKYIDSLLPHSVLDRMSGGL